jgi:hypothetical protein
MAVSGQFQAPTALLPRKINPSSHCMGGRVNPRARLDAMEKTETLAPAGNRITAVQPAVRCYTNRALPVHEQIHVLLYLCVASLAVISTG